MRGSFALCFLSGCIWISKEEYQDRLVCVSEEVVDADSLNIRGDLDAAGDAGLVLLGEDYSAFGWSVSALGDLNYDGTLDWAVGASDRLLLGFGASVSGDHYPLAGDGDGAWTLITDDIGYGRLLAATSASDLTGDGMTDLLLYATGYVEPTQSVDVGVYLFASDDVDWSASALGLSQAWPILAGDVDDSAHAFKGLDVVVFGETATEFGGDGDGFNGVLIAGWLDHSGNCLSPDTGSLYFFDGPRLTSLWRNESTLRSSDWAAATFLRHYEDSPAFGCVTVARAGDFDGDGLSDAILGTPSYASQSVQKGAAFILSGAELSTETPLGIDGLSPLWLDTDGTPSLVGFSVSTAGDVDDDGYDDVLVGTNETGTSGEISGMARLYGGAAALPEHPLLTLLPEDGSEIRYFGDAVAGSGDIDGDCIWDIVVGGLGADGQEFRYVFLGANLQDLPANGSLTSADAQAAIGLETTWNMGGRTLSTPTDVDGDGFADLLLGAPGRDNGDGALFFFFGGAR